MYALQSSVIFCWSCVYYYDAIGQDLAFFHEILVHVYALTYWGQKDCKAHVRLFLGCAFFLGCAYSWGALIYECIQYLSPMVWKEVMSSSLSTCLCAVHLFLICGRKIGGSLFCRKIICGSPHLREEKVVGGWNGGKYLVVFLLPPTFFLSLKWGEPQKILPQNRLPPHQTKKRASLCVFICRQML